MKGSGSVTGVRRHMLWLRCQVCVSKAWVRESESENLWRGRRGRYAGEGPGGCEC